MNIAKAIALMLALTHCCDAADEFGGYVQQLSETIPERDAVRALHVLEQAGMRAFPTLIAHFGDHAPLLTRLRMRAVDGIPTVGDMCFDLLQT